MVYGHSHFLCTDMFVSTVHFRVKYDNGVKVLYIPWFYCFGNMRLVPVRCLLGDYPDRYEI